MEREHIVSILESLSQGQPAEVAEALTAAATVLRKSARHSYAGVRWSADEDARLACEHDSGMPVRAIAERHGRSVSAITLRLVKLGRIDAGAVTTSRSRGARVAI